MWIIMVWQRISPQAIVKGFKKFCIPNAVDGTDDDMLYVIEDGDFRHKCEEDEGTDDKCR